MRGLTYKVEKSLLERPGKLISQNDDCIPILKKKMNMLFATSHRYISSISGNSSIPAMKWEGWLNSYKNSSNFRFPGAQPVSLTSDYVEDISKNKGEYICCEKTDGVRYLMIQMLGGRTFLLSRKCEFYQVSMERIDIFCNHSLPSNGFCAFFDGELVIDTINEVQSLHFLVFDSLHINGCDTIGMNFVGRLCKANDILKQTIVTNNKYTCVPGVRVVTPIRIFMKDMFKVAQLRYIFENIIPHLPHENDGVIFTKVSCPYYPDKVEEIQKWKPPDLNSIDFYLKVPSKEQRGILGEYLELCCMKGKEMVLYDYYFSESECIYPPSAIVECFYDMEKYTESQGVIKYIEEKGKLGNITEKELREYKLEYLGRNENENMRNKYKGGWNIIRRRTDKCKPNAFHVAVEIRKTIRENIGKEYLYSKFGLLSKEKLVGERGDMDGFDDDEDDEDEEDVGDDDDPFNDNLGQSSLIQDEEALNFNAGRKRPTNPSLHQTLTPSNKRMKLH